MKNLDQIIALYVGFATALAIIMPRFVTIIHELGHAVMVMILGGKVVDIYFFGYTNPETHRSYSGVVFYKGLNKIWKQRLVAATPLLFHIPLVYYFLLMIDGNLYLAFVPYIYFIMDIFQWFSGYFSTETDTDGYIFRHAKEIYAKNS